MADEEKSEAAGDGAAGEGELEFLGWQYCLLSLERVHVDPEDEDVQDIFAAKF